MLLDSQLLRGDNYAALETKVQIQLKFEDVWDIVSGHTTSVVSPFGGYQLLPKNTIYLKIIL